MTERILIVEDDERLANLIREYLVHYGYTVEWHDRGDTAESVILAMLPDLLILDVMLPGKSGFDICRDIRPLFGGLILILTAREDDIDEIVGLELGADDYLAKPVEPRRLLARIRALLRRKQTDNQEPNELMDDQTGFVSVVPDGSRLRFGSLYINGETRQVMLDGEPVEFTTAEFDLLWLLASHAGQILSRDDILNSLRGISFDGLDRSIDARISRLRKKLNEDPDYPKRIKTVRGKGYLFFHEQKSA
ncbi:MAG: winged helix-turn-helix domain-containing protein [Betaproteobacteria bacterium]|nr:winged helix-turn-helix domain-containing protein [Betaproteobacteria bacterium]